MLSDGFIEPKNKLEKPTIKTMVHKLKEINTIQTINETTGEVKTDQDYVIYKLIKEGDFKFMKVFYENFLPQFLKPLLPEKTYNIISFLLKVYNPLSFCTLKTTAMFL